MPDEIDDEGPGPSRATSSSHFSKAATTLSGQREQSSRPQNQPALDRQNALATTTSTRQPIVQPKPQALPKRSGPASIIVSPRQKGNPILERIKSMPWEYGDIPADYLLGITTCALFLSLKYHRLHPEYIYTRIKGLQGKYLLRIVLCMVDIQNHEESLKELSKTSLINDVTIVLCWSAAEGARYLELFKVYENAAPTAIKQHQSTAYADRMVDFITTPRSVNKTDAVSLVSQFGTVRTAINAREEEVGSIAGWGEKKVQQWCKSVREPFRIKRAAKRGLDLENLVASQPISLSRGASRAEITATGNGDADRRLPARLAEQDDLDADDEDVLAEMTATRQWRVPEQTATPIPAEAPPKRKANEDPLIDGVMAALSKLRKT